MDEFSHSAPKLQNWKLTLAYDGTLFKGWQVQPDERTIQGELQKALGRITGEAPLPQGSGRTDAGVHALAQVASFVLKAPIPPDNLQRALNRTLPISIRILEAKTVRGSFHARHSAVGKTYEYRIFLENPEKWTERQGRGMICPPFMAPYVYSCRWPLKMLALQESANAFIGEHDFLSFAATDPDLATRGLALNPNSLPERKTERDLSQEFDPRHKPPMETTIRTIFSSAWEMRQTESGNLLVYRIRGSGFLHHMVRNLVGTMLEVGRGQLPASEIPEILAAHCRSAAGPTAPARGLFLHSVEYDGAE